MKRLTFGNSFDASYSVTEKPHFFELLNKYCVYMPGKARKRTRAFCQARPVSGEKGRCSWWRNSGYQNLLGSGGAALYAESPERNMPSRTVCHHLLCGEGDRTTNKRRVHASAELVSRRPSAEQSKTKGEACLILGRTTAFSQFYSASRRKSVYRKKVMHAVWLPYQYSH